MSSKIAIDQGIQATVMGIRECLMDYFAGGCVDRMTSGNIMTRPIEMPANRRYLRNRMTLDRYTVVFIQDVPVLVMLSNPDRVILQAKVFDRSREFQRVGRGVERAIRKYLKDVTVEVNEKSELLLPGPSGETMKLTTRKQDDVALVTANSLKLSGNSLVLDEWPDISAYQETFRASIANGLRVSRGPRPTMQPPVSHLTTGWAPAGIWEMRDVGVQEQINE